MATSTFPPAENPAFTALFSKFIAGVSGVQAVLVSTCEGVPLIKVVGKQYDADLVAYSETKLAYVFAVAASQAANLRLGHLNTIVSYFESNVLMHINHGPGISGPTDGGAGQAPVAGDFPLVEPLR